jgi:stage V sporulation protein AC
MDKSEKAKQDYQDLVKKASPNSLTLRDCIRAFISGGIICTIGEIIKSVLNYIGYDNEESAMLLTIILVFTGVLLTGLDVYERLGKFCGAGTVVPITGFANSVASPAIEYKKEGFVFGVGSKMFIIAGPVIVYATISSVVVGLIYYLIKYVF